MSQVVALRFHQSIHERLLSAMYRGDRPAMEALLEQGASPNHPDVMGDTAVLWAAALGEIHMLDPLLAHGGTLNHINAQGDTVLHAAARHGHAALLAHLLPRMPQANLEQPNHAGATAWSLVLAQPKAVAVEVLAQCGPRPQWSPRQAANRLTQAMIHSEGAMTAVLAAGAAVGWDTRNDQGNTPWDLLRERIDLAMRFRPEGAPVLAFRRRHP